ncbi:MAG: RnfABCDGE type electron transport complex subunit D [Proteobacteria bacterium]|nr:RnfABCDGE type electron transport complex subunit D [Pseudomonadota bacterium]
MRAFAPRPPRRAVSLRTRSGWMLLALGPGFALQAVAFGPDFAGSALITYAALFALDVLWRRREANPQRDRQPLLLTAIALCWLPPALPGWSHGAAASVAWLLARRCGRDGGSAFHPAMVGCALAALPFGDAPRNAVEPSLLPAIAAAFTLAGIALAIGRCIRWPVAVAVLAGGTATAATWLLLAPLPTHDHLLTALPGASLLVFFIATDPASGCQWPRARWAFGVGLGVLAALAMLSLHDERRRALAMAGSVLLMNAAAPTLDRLLPLPRRPESTHP